MSGHVYVCKHCEHESKDAPGVLAHREGTGHIGASLRFDRTSETESGPVPSLFMRAAFTHRLLLDPERDA